MRLHNIFAFLLIPAIISTGFGKPDKTNKPLMEFHDMKFGMFIHWGLYAVPAGIWKGKYVRGIGEWIMRRAEIPVKEYEQLAKKFNPVKFNADEWAQLAEDAGMKYMVITSKHHDGFAMFGSKASAYNIVDATPYKKDPMKALSAACAKKGIKFGFYYSQAQDWHEPNAAGNNWDFPKERDPQSYVKKKALPQVEEILSNYGSLALIWFDTPQLLTKEQVIGLRKMVKTKQPNCLVNSRIGHEQGDYDQMGDNAIPVQTYTKNIWEVPATLNDTWGFKKDDHNWKDPKDLIYKLADIVSKGGNYLLNVGPTAEGIIPKESQRILRKVGQWIKKNGESIYGTSPSPFYYEQNIWRCTVKPGKMYIHILNWPGEQLEIDGLKSKIKKITFLNNTKTVYYLQKGTKVIVKLPAAPPDKYNTVLVMEINDKQPDVAAEYRYDTPRDQYVLHAFAGRMHGEDNRFDRKTLSVTGFKEGEKPRNELIWYHYADKEAEYSVEMEYACEDSRAGSNFLLDNRLKHSKNRSVIRGKIQGTGGKFVIHKLGKLKIHANVENRIFFTLIKDFKSSGMKVRKVILTKND